MLAPNPLEGFHASCAEFLVAPGGQALSICRDGTGGATSQAVPERMDLDFPFGS